jgi:phenylalanyl-tRNA synthetase beta chain
MEYSLYTLNKKTNLKNLTSTELINTLNLIGFEVDDIETLPVSTNKFLVDKKLVLKIPANREDLLNEKLLLKDFSVLFLFEIYQTWEILKKKYNFLINQISEESKNIPVYKIQSNDAKSVVYKIDFKISHDVESPLWLKNKLSIHGFPCTNIVNDILNLVLLEFGSNFGCSFSKKFNENDNLEFSILEMPKITTNEFNETISLKGGACILKTPNNEINTLLADVDVFIEKKKLNKHFSDSENHSNETILSLNFIFNPIFEKNNLEEQQILKQYLPFLRKSFSENVSQSFQRVLTLLEIVGKGTFLNVYSTEYENFNLGKSKLLELQKSYLCKTLNLLTPDSKVFQKAGLTIRSEDSNSFVFEIPTSRKDLEREIDLIEEYSRFIGYKNFKEILPTKSLLTSKKSVKHYELIQNFFINTGFTEIFTNSLDETKEQKNQMLITNPLNQEFSGLRTNNFDKLFSIFDVNLKLGIPNLKIFEIGRVFKRVNKKIIEQDKLTGIFELNFIRDAQQADYNWLTAKGYLENFLVSFGYEDSEFEKIEIGNRYYHPTRSVIIKRNNKILGRFGEINPNIIGFDSFKAPIFIFDFNLNHFKQFKISSTIKIAKDYSKYPSIFKDLSFLVDKSTNFSNLVDRIKSTTNNLKNIEFFDVYQDSSFISSSENKVNLGIRLEFQALNETLTTEYVENEITRLKSDLENLCSVIFKD